MFLSLKVKNYWVNSLCWWKLCDYCEKFIKLLVFVVSSWTSKPFTNLMNIVFNEFPTFYNVTQNIKLFETIFIESFFAIWGFFRMTADSFMLKPTWEKQASGNFFFVVQSINPHQCKQGNIFQLENKGLTFSFEEKWANFDGSKKFEFVLIVGRIFSKLLNFHELMKQDWVNLLW